MIPSQTFESFPVFSDTGTKVKPGDAKYSAGFQQSDVLPAEWVNWEWNKASKGVTDLNTGLTSVEAEINSVLTGAGKSPDETKTNQLYQSIAKLIDDAETRAKLAAHPIGSLYWSSDSTNPGQLFGGTWVQIKDKFILAAGDTYTNGGTGGAATVTLTTNEMPAHNHTGTTTQENTGHTHGFSYSYKRRTPNANGLNAFVYFKQETSGYTLGYTEDTVTVNDQSTYGSSNGHTHDYTTSTVGNGAAHNNMPPYIVKYCWERTA